MGHGYAFLGRVDLGYTRGRSEQHLGLSTHNDISPPEFPSTMLSSAGDGEFYPGRDLSVSQLLQAVRKKLRHTLFDGRCAGTVTVTRKITQLKFCRITTTLNQKEVSETKKRCPGLARRLTHPSVFRLMR